MAYRPTLAGKPFPDRWWYGAPWKRSHPFRPAVKIYRCGDEYCNDTLYLGFPLLGDVTIRINRHIRPHGRCEECTTELGPWCDGCGTCHQGPRCHAWVECPHGNIAIQSCPTCGGSYCPKCEPDATGHCPARQP